MKTIEGTVNEVINDAFFDWYYLKEHGDSNEWLKEFEVKR